MKNNFLFFVFRCRSTCIASSLSRYLYQKGFETFLHEASDAWEKRFKSLLKIHSLYRYIKVAQGIIQACLQVRTFFSLSNN